MAATDDTDLEADFISFINDTSVFSQTSDRDVNKENGTCQTVDNKYSETKHKCWDSIANENVTSLNYHTKVDLIVLQDTDHSQERTFYEELTQQDTEGDTPLHIAIINQQTSCALFIIQFLTTAQLSTANEIGQTPLHLAAIVGDFQVIDALIAKEVDFNKRDTKGRTLFHILCQSENVRCLSLLVPILNTIRRHSQTSNVDSQNLLQALNAKDFEGKSCLHLICIQGNLKLVNILLSLDINPNLQDDKSGRSALHFSAEYGHLKVTQALIQHEGTNVNSESYDGISPVILAYHRKQHRIVAFLRKHGASFSRRKIEKFGAYRK